MKKRGIKVRQTFQRKVNFNPFQDLDNQEVQYWLGWLITDGNVFKNRISLNSTGKDLDVLKKYCKFLKIDESNIQIIKLKNPNHDDKCVVRFTNIEVADFLFKIGITPKKSFTVNPIIKFTSDLVRGLYEGDGHIKLYTNKKGLICGKTNFVTASKFLIKKLYSFLLKNNIEYHTSKQDNCYIINIGGVKSLKLLDLIYPKNCKLYSERKFKQYQLIKNHYKC